MKFKYRDKVRVIKGFYIGLEGTIDNYRISSMPLDEVRYNIDFQCVIDNTMIDMNRCVREDYLELLK